MLRKVMYCMLNQIEVSKGNTISASMTSKLGDMNI